MPRSVVADPLSWDSSRSRPSPPTLLPERRSSTGPLRPSIDLVPGVHSRADIAAVASVRRCHPPDPVPTSPILTVSPVYSADWPACTCLCAIAGAGFAGLLHPAADPGVRCVSHRHPGGSWHPTLAIAGRCAAGHANSASSQRDSYPSKDSPHPQPCRVATTVAPLMFAFRAVFGRLVASVTGFDARVATAWLQHLRGVAPQMSPYRNPPFPARIRPILTGLWPPSRSFDRGIAPVADASRTLCAGIPANEILVRSPPLLSLPWPRPEVKELRSVPPPLLRRSRSNLPVGDPSAGHGGEGFVAPSFDVTTAMKQVPR